jgi:phosphohistidine swiveling domain-containing protein
MIQVYELDELLPDQLSLAGGKAMALARLKKAGFEVPNALCITTTVYNRYLDETRLRENLLMELGRKRFEDMRWEEIWDVSLRIRNLFLRTPLPPGMNAELFHHLEVRFGDSPAAVRSSAPGEDSATSSFAGLHESFINIVGVDQIIEHIRLVWASLWSDRALLYRKEMGLDPAKSTMAVLVQQILSGECSGVAFGQSPLDPDQAVVEAVYGLNQGLVDGSVQPDRWTLERGSGKVLSHTPVERTKAVRPAQGGVKYEPLPMHLRQQPPMNEDQISQVFQLNQACERLYQTPQDMEWTWLADTCHLLQSRAITSLQSQDQDSERIRYLGLRRSLQNLKELQVVIADQLIPNMKKEAESLSRLDLGALNDHQLAEEIETRKTIFDRWEAEYWRYCIPFAHGMRLFGQVYNDRIKPDDPYQFMELLTGADLDSTNRNQSLQDMAEMVRQDDGLRQMLQKGMLPGPEHELHKALLDFQKRHAGGGWSGRMLDMEAAEVCRLVLQLSKLQKAGKADRQLGADSLAEAFLGSFPAEQKSYAYELLEIGRQSYALRDNDNVYIGLIEGQLFAAVGEGRRRLGLSPKSPQDALEGQVVAAALRGESVGIPSVSAANAGGATGDFSIKARQLVGQPAGPGLAVGKARLVLEPGDLFSFQAGEVLVCDAVDPNMTFVVPLACAVVERRGGMLIHGAIIAREYGLPCVTGVPQLTQLIKNGDILTVDGHSGLVIVGEPALPDPSD